MTSPEAARQRQLWHRVYQHEISRRKTILQEKPKAYKKLFSSNPKRLDDCCTGEHCWVPATILWIHDNVGRGYKIDGFKRRGFHEASPYKVNGYRVIPQMCWNCTQSREKVSPLQTWSERQKTLADHIRAESAGKPRGRQGGDAMIEDLDDLFIT